MGWGPRLSHWWCPRPVLPVDSEVGPHPGLYPQRSPSMQAGPRAPPHRPRGSCHTQQAWLRACVGKINVSEELLSILPPGARAVQWPRQEGSWASALWWEWPGHSQVPGGLLSWAQVPADYPFPWGGLHHCHCSYQCLLLLLFPLRVFIPQREPLNGYDILFSSTLFFTTLCALPE